MTSTRFFQLSLGTNMPAPDIGTNLLGLNSATAGAAFGFRVPQGETLSAVRVFYGATGGGVPTTLGTNCSIVTDTNGAPAGTIASGLISGALATKNPTSYTASSINDFTGYSVALTANTSYWVVFTNATAVPGTNFQQVQYIRSGGTNGSPDLAGLAVTGGSRSIGFPFVSTSDGSSWSSGGNNPLNTYGIRLQFASGRYLGAMFTNSAIDTSNTVFAARAYGPTFTTPSTWPSVNVSSVSMHISRAGTAPASGFVFNIYQGSNTTPIANGTSATVTGAQFLDVSGWYRVNFPTSPVLLANTQYTIAIAVQNGSDGSSGNDYRLYGFTLDNDANSKAQMPFGALSANYLNSTWTATSTFIIPFQLWLDDSGEFTVPASGHPASRTQGGM